MVIGTHGYHAGYLYGNNGSKAVNCVGDPVKQLTFSKHVTKDKCQRTLKMLSLVEMLKKYTPHLCDSLSTILFTLECRTCNKISARHITDDDTRPKNTVISYIYISYTLGG